MQVNTRGGAVSSMRTGKPRLVIRHQSLSVSCAVRCVALSGYFVHPQGHHVGHGCSTTAAVTQTGGQSRYCSKYTGQMWLEWTSCAAALTLVSVLLRRPHGQLRLRVWKCGGAVIGWKWHHPVQIYCWKVDELIVENPVWETQWGGRRTSLQRSSWHLSKYGVDTARMHRRAKEETHTVWMFVF